MPGSSRTVRLVPSASWRTRSTSTWLVSDTASAAAAEAAAGAMSARNARNILISTLPSVDLDLERDGPGGAGRDIAEADRDSRAGEIARVRVGGVGQRRAVEGDRGGGVARAGRDRIADPQIGEAAAAGDRGGEGVGDGRARNLGGAAERIGDARALDEAHAGGGDPVEA